MRGSTMKISMFSARARATLAASLIVLGGASIGFVPPARAQETTPSAGGGPAGGYA